MRIDTDLQDVDRAAVKKYAEANNLTMKGAYTRLLRDALFTRTSIGYYPDPDTIGIKWHGFKSSIRTNVGRERFFALLESNPNEQFSLYMPRKFAVEAGYDNVDVSPSIFDLQTGNETPPESKD